MKKRKLVLALMLSLMMLVTMIPSFSFADGTGGTGSSAESRYEKCCDFRDLRSDRFMNRCDVEIDTE